MEPENGECGVAVTEQIERRPRLLVGAPEDRGTYKEERHGADPLPLDSGQSAKGLFSGRPGSSCRDGFGTMRETLDGRTEAIPVQDKLDQSEGHADAGAQE